MSSSTINDSFFVNLASFVQSPAQTKELNPFTCRSLCTVDFFSASTSSHDSKAVVRFSNSFCFIVPLKTDCRTLNFLHADLSKMIVTINVHFYVDTALNAAI